MNRKTWWAMTMVVVLLFGGAVAVFAAGGQAATPPAEVPEVDGFAAPPQPVPFSGYVKQNGVQTTVVYVDGSGTASGITVGTASGSGGGGFAHTANSVSVSYAGGSACLAGLDQEVPATGVSGTPGSTVTFTFQPMTGGACNGSSAGTADTVTATFAAQASS